MNIDERCYGYEPAQSQLDALRQKVAKLEFELKEATEEIYLLSGLVDPDDYASAMREAKGAKQ